jgi:hypothetical protein
MSKLIDRNPQIMFGLLFTLTIALAIVGIVAEVVFITNHLELVARQISLLTVGGISN